MDSSGGVAALYQSMTSKNSLQSIIYSIFFFIGITKRLLKTLEQQVFPLFKKTLLHHSAKFKTIEDNFVKFENQEAFTQ